MADDDNNDLQDIKGLSFEAMIGGPLQAALEASISLSRSTADYIQQLGFTPEKKDENGNITPGEVRTVDFKFERPNIDDSTGDSIMEEVHISVPLLAIVPLPNLQIERLRTTFTLEVTTSIHEENNVDGTESYKIYGKQSAHSSNVRSTDKAAKYYVELEAAYQGMPESLARILDIMASGVAPKNIRKKSA